MNNFKSYTEYAVSTPTVDFVIGFDFNYGTDAVNVTVDGVPATEAGYSVIYLNSTTMRVSPAVPSGVVRLQRETDIDVPDNQFTAGAKFIASNMDENFTQIRHAQQEVRDGFSRLSEDTYEIIDTLQEVGQSAQDAADAAEQAAITANDAAAQVNDKVSYQDLDNAIAATPHNNFTDRDAVDAHPDSAIKVWSGRTQGDKNKEIVSPKDFGCTSGIENTSGLQNFFNYITSNQCTGDLLKGCNWVFKNLNIPNGVKLVGNSVLRHDGTGNRVTGSDTLITFNGDEDIECLHISTPATENIYYLAHFNGNNHSIKTLKITADYLHIAPSYSEGIRMYGDNIDIGLFESKNHRRPLQIYNQNLAIAWNKSVNIGVMIVDQYIRGLNISGYDGINIGTLKVSGQHQGAEARPGHNGTLFGAVKNMTINTLWVEDSMEHAVRFGGDIFDTEDITINNIIVKRSNQCAFKTATTPPTKIKNLNIGTIWVLDGGRGSTLGNTELVRLTSYEDVTIGKIIGRHTSAHSSSTRTALVHNSGSGLSIDLIDVTDVAARMVQVYGDNDMGTGNVLNTRIGLIKGNLLSASARYAIGIYLPRTAEAPDRVLGNYIIEDMDVRGFSHGLITNEDAKFFNPSGVIHIKAKTTGSNAPVSDLLTTAQLSNPENVFLDLTHNGNRFVGGGSVDFGANFSLKPKALTENILKLLSVPSSELIGNKVVFSRPSGDRNGAGIAVKQGSSVARCGLVFFTTNSATTSNENLIESLELKPSGVLSIKNPQVFASNAAATSGGLVAGDIYWTSSGEMRIVV